MAKVIEFYVPKNFGSAFVRAAQPPPGKLIEFCSEAKKSGATRPAAGVLAWLVEATEPNRAIGNEQSSDPSVA
jgi:hypothetical protein